MGKSSFAHVYGRQGEMSPAEATICWNIAKFLSHPQERYRFQNSVAYPRGEYSLFSLFQAFA